jgi:hypothetical protein
MVISVFKTNISEKNLSQLDSKFSQLQEVIDWNTDLDDCDKVLRVVSRVDISSLVPSLLKEMNLECKELE